MATLDEQLASVQAQIASIERGAQSTTYADGSGVNRASLQTLYERERELQLRIDWRDHGRVRAVEVP